MLNQSITIHGNVVRGLDRMTSKSGVPGVKFRLAHNNRFYDQAAQDWRDTDAVFIDCAVWGSAADNVYASVGAGDPIIVIGRLRDASWTDNDNVNHPKMEITADSVSIDLRRGRVGRYQKFRPETPPAGDDVPADASSIAGAEGAVPAFGSLDAAAGSHNAAGELVGAAGEPPF